MKNVVARLRRKLGTIERVQERLDLIQEAIGRIEARQTAGALNLGEAEFRVFSQWGEDGCIQHLIRHVPIASRTFIEFGVQDYMESNTRFLLVNDNWSGLVIDGGALNIEAIRRSDLYWRYNLKAECAFITRDNIDTLITTAGLRGDIGLLSVDIDGNDYWVWEAIESVRPRILITEYNARFGTDAAVTVPYAADFQRTAAHHSHIYYGASLAALTALSARKGYDLVGCNAAGNNAFFVRRDVRPASLPVRGVRDAYRPAKFREARTPDGALAFLSPEQEQALLSTLPVVTVDGPT
ncbi:hypothetical protein ACQR1I_35700 [Bradyrhizobium sp. HKCCYLS2038]|uniref:hypothetical protein n=1 Tax=unclassified Bradyrhizobium TaxID=2631580 RepID=UPI003EBB7096